MYWNRYLPSPRLRIPISPLALLTAREHGRVLITEAVIAILDNEYLLIGFLISNQCHIIFSCTDHRIVRNRYRTWQEQEHGTHDGRHDDENGYAQGAGVQGARPAGGQSPVGQQARLPAGHRHRAEEVVQPTEARHVRGGRPPTPRVVARQRFLQLRRMGSFLVRGCAQHGLLGPDPVSRNR